MKISDLHVHTTFCDGKCTIDEMAEHAIEMGMKSLGFSSHGFTDFDDTFCMKEESLIPYVNAVNEAKDKYKGKIQIYLGTEKDLYSGKLDASFDYKIGSLHYVYKDGKYLSVDHCEAAFVEDVKNHFDGSYIEYAKLYYAEFARLLQKDKYDIVGHFDLVSKFNTGGKYYDEGNREYQNAALEVMALAKEICPIVEMNTGAISRGYRKTPYLRRFILDYIRDNNMKVVLTSDSHTYKTLCFGFDQAIEILKDAGINSVVALLDGEFKEIGI